MVVLVVVELGKIAMSLGNSHIGKVLRLGRHHACWRGKWRLGLHRTHLSILLHLLHLLHPVHLHLHHLVHLLHHLHLCLLSRRYRTRWHHAHIWHGWMTVIGQSIDAHRR